MTSTPNYRELGREYGIRSRAEQGLPEKVEDPKVIARLRQILRPSIEAPRRSA